jgi:hypothetical protein
VRAPYAMINVAVLVFETIRYPAHDEIARAPKICLQQFRKALTCVKPTREASAYQRTRKNLFHLA